MDLFYTQLFSAVIQGLCLGLLLSHLFGRPKLESDIRVSSARAGNQHVGLSWKDSFPKFGMGSIEYIVLRKDGLFRPWKEIAVTRKMSLIDADVVPGKRYWYKICGNRKAIEGNSFRASDRVKVVA